MKLQVAQRLSAVQPTQESGVVTLTLLNQRVVSMMAAIVAPLGRRSSATTRTCFELARVP
jgi:hypothetical protein